MKKYKEVLERVENSMPCYVDEDFHNKELTRLVAIEYSKEIMPKAIVVWKDGTHKAVEDGITWEYENDSDWLVTINLQELLKH